MKTNIFLIIFLLAFFLNEVFADISISASVDKNVISLNEQVNLQIVVSGDVSNIPQPKIPSLENFQVYSSGRSQSISIINGQVSSTVSFNYILSPKKIGEFEIPPIVVEYKGKVYQTEPIKIKVEAITKQQPLPLEKNVYKGQKRDLFVEAFVDKTKAYVNEQITLTFRFYTKINLLSQPQYTPPDTTGFLSEDLPPQKNYYTIINNERYFVNEIKTALFPTTAGRFTIGPATVRCVIEDFSFDDDFFSDSFFKRFFSEGKEVILKTEPIEINVLPLPQPQPDLFSGSVGSYKIDVSVDKNKLEQNETTFLNIKVSGVGNIKTVMIPKNLIEKMIGRNFLLYDPITSFDIKKENYLVKGTKTFKIPISPVVVGNLVIPSIKFVYFNPQTKQYETALSQQISLEVITSSKKQIVSNLIQPKYANKKEERIELEDIRYLKTNFSYRKLDTKKNIYIILQFLPITFWLCFVFYGVYQKNLLKNIDKYKSSKAFSNFKKRIRKVREENFVEKLYDAVCNYFSDKFNISKEAISLDHIKKMLEGKVKNETLKKIIDIWEEINFYRFAPIETQNVNSKELVKKILETIKELEYEM